MQTTISNPVINAISRTAEQASLTLDELRALRTIVWRAAGAGANDFQIVAIGRRFVASCVVRHSIGRAKVVAITTAPPPPRQSTKNWRWRAVELFSAIALVASGALFGIVIGLWLRQ